MELLRLKERIEIAIEMGESHFREFKSGLQGPAENKVPRPVKEICQDISKTLVAFANADGGELLIGVEDDGSITGLPHDDDLLKVLFAAPKTYVLQTTPLPTTKASIVDYNGKKVIYFSIPKGSEHVYITSDGKCLKRKDLESIPVSPESIQFEREEISSREYDRLFVDDADVTDLDTELLNHVAKEFSRTITAEKYLQHLDLAEFDGNKLRLRKAALLLFAKNPIKWHPRLQVRVLKLKGNELRTGKDYNVINDEDVSGNILTLIENAWELLRPYLTETKMSSDAIFKTQILYPDLACKEALINAIAHRDYSIEGRGIEVFVYDDRLEIKSPGMLLNSIKISDINKRIGVHQSRNTHIARILKEIGYMRELGEGFRRIFELMESYDLTPPQLLSADKSFLVSFSQKLIYTKEEKIWLENFETIELSKEEKTIVRLGANGDLLSPKLIWDTVGIVDTDDYRQLIESLRNKGLLTSEVSKPQAIAIATKSKKDKKSIARFRITIPTQKEKKDFVETAIKHQAAVKNKPIDESDYSTLFIENLPYDCTEEEIEKLFSKFGEVETIRIPKSEYSGKCKGFGFIEFEKLDSAKQALKERLTLYIKGRKIIVKKFEVK